MKLLKYRKNIFKINIFGDFYLEKIKKLKMFVNIWDRIDE